MLKLILIYSKNNLGTPLPTAVPNPIPKSEPSVPKCLYPTAPKYPTPVVVLNYLYDMI